MILCSLGGGIEINTGGVSWLYSKNRIFWHHACSIKYIYIKRISENEHLKETVLFKKYTFVYVFMMLGLVLTASSCKEKQYSKDNNPNMKTVENLNKGDYLEVIDRLGSKKSLSSRDKFYLASAYALKGGADIYSIYPMMEVVLFHKKAIDWDELKNDKNPYAKFVRQTERKKSSEEEKIVAWEKYLKDYNKYGDESELRKEVICEDYILEEPFVQLLVDYCKNRKSAYEFISDDLLQKRSEDSSDIFFSIYSSVDTWELSTTINEFGKSPKLSFETLDFLNNELEDSYYELKANNPEFPFNKFSYKRLTLEESFDHVAINSQLTPSETSVLLNDVREKLSKMESNLFDYYSEHQSIRLKRKLFFEGRLPVNQKQSIEMMNLLWNIYETIPIIQRLPKISLAQQDEITSSLVILKTLLKDPEYKIKSAKMITMLTMFSLMSILADTTDLERVSQPYDFPCHMDERKMIEYKPVIYDRIDFIASIIEEENLSESEKATFEGTQAYLDMTNRYMSKEEEASFIENHLANKVMNCDPESYL